MVFEKPDPVRFPWSKVNMNDKIQQLYESIVFPDRSQLAENGSCPCFSVRTYFQSSIVSPSPLKQGRSQEFSRGPVTEPLNC